MASISRLNFLRQPFLRARASIAIVRISNSVLVSVLVSDWSPNETETSGFHHIIAWCL